MSRSTNNRTLIVEEGYVGGRSLNLRSDLFVFDSVELKRRREAKGRRIGGVGPSKKSSEQTPSE